MPQAGYYRYVSTAECQYIRDNKEINSLSGVTYYTPDRYDDNSEAQRKLAMFSLPDYRIGPISADDMPDFDVVSLQPVGFVDPLKPGGGVEAATSRPVFLLAAFNLNSRTYDALL